MNSHEEDDIVIIFVSSVPHAPLPALPQVAGTF